MLAAIRGMVPNWLRKSVLAPLRRRIAAVFLAIGNRVLGIGDPLVPPVSQNTTGYGNFRAIGYKIVILLIKYCGLKPQHSVLDIGCGMGRVAAGLLDYLGEDAHYLGLDVVPAHIEWCQRKLAPRHANFRFEHLNIENADYNPKGTIHGTEFTIPLGEDSADVIFLTSVFTHLTPEVTVRYLEEMSRVLRPGGKVFSTWFLYDSNETRPEVLAPMKTELGFSKPEWPHARFKYRDNPEATIGFTVPWVLEQVERAGLKLHGEVQYGGWAGAKRRRIALGQDVLLLTK